jgi:pimeloyl-ACP methyl ester carboxylesterase
MQFAYQYPERTERVVLVGAGGLGRDVHPVLRALTLPGAGAALAVAAAAVPRKVARSMLLTLHRARMPGAVDLAEMVTVYDGLGESQARSAFLHVLRAAVDWRGQVVTMLDRSYLAAGMPVCVVWGVNDSVIPADHARVAERALPHARLEIFDDAGHFPHRADPLRFVDVLTSFVNQTPRSQHDRADWRALMMNGSS